MIAMKDPRNDDKNLWVGWDEYHRLIELLALGVHESAGSSTRSCVSRAAVLRVGDQLSRIYDLPLAILATSSYREAAGTEQGELDIAQYITMTRGELHGNVLLVDDLVDSGVTLARVQQHLKDAIRRSPRCVGGALVQGLLEGEARLPRAVSAYQSVDSPAVRGMGHGASA
jgi:Predicted phosphoribosyltransferases